MHLLWSVTVTAASSPVRCPIVLRRSHRLNEKRRKMAPLCERFVSSQITCMMSLECKSCSEHCPDNFWSFFFFFFFEKYLFKGEPEVQSDRRADRQDEHERGRWRRRWCCWWWFTACLMGGWLKLIPDPCMCGAQKSPTVKGGGGGGGSFSSLFPCISLRLQPETRHITQLTPCCPPHAQSGLISLHANCSLVTTETTQTTAGAKGCPLCLHGWAPKTNEEAWGGFRLSGREEITGGGECRKSEWAS